MTLTQTPTLEQMPSFLVGLASEVLSIKESLANTTTVAEIEKPVNVAAAAEHTDLEEQTIYKLARLKKIPFYKQGRKLYFYRSELNEWIKSGKPGLADELKSQAEGRFLEANKNRRG